MTPFDSEHSRQPSTSLLCEQPARDPRYCPPLLLVFSRDSEGTEREVEDEARVTQATLLHVLRRNAARTEHLLQL